MIPGISATFSNAVIIGSGAMQRAGRFFFDYVNSVNNTDAERLYNEIPEETSAAKDIATILSRVSMAVMGASFAYCSYLLWSVKRKNSDARQPQYEHLKNILITVDGRSINLPRTLVEKLEQVNELNGLHPDLIEFPKMTVDDIRNVNYDIKKFDVYLDAKLGRAFRKLCCLYDHYPLQLNALFIRKALELFESEPKNMLVFNRLFIQLMVMANQPEWNMWCQRAHQLYDNYLTLKPIVGYAKTEEFGAYGTGTVDWSDEHAANYIVFPLDYDHIGPVMLISQHVFEKLMEPDPLQPVWDNFYLYHSPEQPVATSDYPLHTLFEIHYPLFLPAFNSVEGAQALPDLLKSIIGDEKMRHIFAIASCKKKSEIKLIDNESNKNLEAIFSPWMNYSTEKAFYRLNEKHYDSLIRMQNLSEASDKDKAVMLLNLATIFVKYSSGAIFGIDNDSPQMVRFYAYALMEKAYRLDKTIFLGSNTDRTALKDKFPEWEKRLLGIGSAFSCSDILSGMLIEHNMAHFPEVATAMIPLAWL